MGGRPRLATARFQAKALPPIKAVTASPFATPDCESNDPQHEKDGCQYPQYMNRKTRPKENQHE
jgi:hypothetical protein